MIFLVVKNLHPMITYPDPEWYQSLPSELTTEAIFLAGEAAWLPDAAIKVVSWLAEADYIVLGIELWENCNGSPMWIASSNYEYDQLSKLPEYTKLNFAGAIQFIERFREHPGALFNLTVK